jgi:hypothetical protein
LLQEVKEMWQYNQHEVLSRSSASLEKAKASIVDGWYLLFLIVTFLLAVAAAI